MTKGCVIHTFDCWLLPCCVVNLLLHFPNFYLLMLLFIDKIHFIYLEREEERERVMDLLFHLFMNSLVDSYMCPD